MSDFRLKELCLVEAVRDICEDGFVVPKGSTGTVVGIIKEGFGYYVEFTEPMHVITLAARSELKERR